MRISIFLIITIFSSIQLSCQSTSDTENEVLNYVKANPKVLTIVDGKDGVGVVDDKGRIVIPAIYYKVSILPTTSKFKEPMFMVNKECANLYNILTLDNKTIFSEDQHAINKASPGYLIVTPLSKDTSYIVDYHGNQIDNPNKQMISPIIVKKYSPKNEDYYVIGENRGVHLGLLSKELDFVKPLSNLQIKVQEHGIIVRNNSGNGGTLYDLNMNEVWSSEIAIPSHVFSETFVFSNQTNYTSGILNFEGDTLYTSELMRFSDRDIKDNIIVFHTHFSNEYGAVGTDGKVIVPIGKERVHWKEDGGKMYLKYFDENGKQKKYDPLEKKFLDD